MRTGEEKSWLDWRMGECYSPLIGIVGYVEGGAASYFLIKSV